LVLLDNPLPALDGYKDLLAHPEPSIKQLGENDYHYKLRPKAGPLDWSPLVRVVKLSSSLAYRSYLHYANKDIYRRGHYNPDSETFRLCTKLFDDFYRQAEQNGALPVILLFPNRMDLERYRRDATRVYDPLIDYFTARGYRYVDLIAAFEREGQPYPIDDLFGDYHYTPLGHALVARYILTAGKRWF
jgi:cobalamin biosynthesis Mg chelatase CobN